MYLCRHILAMVAALASPIAAFGAICSPSQYLEAHPEITAHSYYAQNPMIHFIVFGSDEGSCEPSSPVPVLQTSIAPPPANGSVPQSGGATSAGAGAELIEGDEAAPPLSKITFLPPVSDEAFRNPGMGWVNYIFEPVKEKVEDIPAYNSPLSSTMYSNYFAMGDLNPYSGQYSFEYIDRLIFKAMEQNQKVSFGIVTSSPNSLPWDGFRGFGITPFWLPNFSDSVRCFTEIQAGQPLKPEKNNSRVGSKNYGCHNEPKYWRSEFLEAHKKFIRALAARYYDPAKAGYSNAPDWRKWVDTIEISTHGFWGEWHSNIVWEGNKKITLRQMIDDYYESFPEEKGRPHFGISMVLDATNRSAADSQLDENGVLYAMEKGASPVRKFIGLDVGIEGTSAAVYFTPREAKQLEKAVEKLPFRGEFGSWNGPIDLFTQNPDGTGAKTTLEQAIKQALALKASELGWYDPAALAGIESETGESLEVYFAKRAGYRLVPTKVEYPSRIERGKQFSLDITWNQKGVAKPYRKFGLRAYLSPRGVPNQVITLAEIREFDATNWPLGESSGHLTGYKFTVPSSGLAKGWYDLRFALVDADGEPAVNLGIHGKDNRDQNRYGRYLVGGLYVQ